VASATSSSGGSTVPDRLVLRGGRVLGASADVGATAVAVEDGRIALVGSDDQAAGWIGTGSDAPDVVDLDGALVAPAFVDSHVHTVRTGFARTGLTLGDARSLTEALDALAAFAGSHPDDGVVVGQGWDETDWPEARPPTGDELERAAPGRRTYLTRVDGHSSVISPALAALVPGLRDLAGWSDDGRVERDAHHAVRNTLETLIGDAERLDAARAACRAMAAEGIVGFHENAAPHIGPESEIELVRRAAAETGLHATVYWGELMAVDTARRLGVAGLAGDLVADGAFGSRTAALTTPYDDAAGTCGHGYVTAEQVRDHVVACTEARLQAGFHVIGDAALEEVATGFELAAAVLGDRLPAGHRLEHVEMPSARVVDVIGRLGIVCSVQPVFDALWGGPAGMYATRLGERWRDTSPFRALAGVTTLALGSDSPVTPLGPWAAVRAAVHPHRPEQALSESDAFRAHTRGGWLAAGVPGAGDLTVGSAAHLAVWHLPSPPDALGMPDLTPGAPLPVLRRLVSAGRTVHQQEAR
jgi:predicted amidohydrolase YtcJ